LIEWYRVGFSLPQLMDEVEELVRVLLGSTASSLASERLTYREAFLGELHIDPFTCSLAELQDAAQKIGFDNGPPEDGTDSRDELLELLMGAVVGPRLGRNSLTFVHGYPASQAALARLDPQDPRAALRFELYGEGVELANGFRELASAEEQRARFESDNLARRGLGRPPLAIDDRLIAALQAGLPECAGVALGFDRTLMLAAGARHIDQVLPFPIELA
jgi:lysyl-tRNA synthetase class 2